MIFDIEKIQFLFLVWVMIVKTLRKRHILAWFLIFEELDNYISAYNLTKILSLSPQ